MPKIQWVALPPALRHHLFDRFKERQITKEDLFALEEWKRRSPDAPEGKWYKDFGTFKICGEGKYPKTFLLRGQVAMAMNSTKTDYWPRARIEVQRLTTT